jgi:chromosome segregation ATPase
MSKKPVRSSLPGSLAAALLCASLYAALGGCATTADCNPAHDPGLIGSIACQSGRRYEQRVEERRNELGQEQEKSANLRAEAASVHAHRKYLDRRLRVARADVDGLQHKVDTINARIRRSEDISTRDRSDMRRIQTQVNKLGDEVQQGEGSRAELDALRRELNEKERQIDEATR